MVWVLAVANQKGGVARTTTVATLGAALAEQGQRVLLVDLDPQACLTFSVGHDPERLELSVHDVLLGRVSPSMVLLPTDEGPDLLPATPDLAGCEARLPAQAGHEYRLRHALEELAATGHPAYDVVLVDCPPSLGVLTINGLTAADELLVPVQAEALAHRGVGQLLDTVEEDIRLLTNPGLTVLGLLPTLFDGRTRHAREVVSDVAERYGLRVLEPAIPRSVRFAETPLSGRTVLATASSSKGAVAYREVARLMVRERRPTIPRPAGGPSAQSWRGTPVSAGRPR